ncbi:hypothetical protein MIND_00687800 [Mycena indigotica]|uniref:F-box domain-containing protein n=1 Tax=Mycena indigotica TaxID=2126181 RepID=A0A8H6SLW4_9AGAR|nr:uncharacterized protein MIND_00687800 [Mycena indigotica]KAF7301230.1 hypothetical protein MIND_00687800 [Mycena indigotica]
MHRLIAMPRRDVEPSGTHGPHQSARPVRNVPGPGSSLFRFTELPPEMCLLIIENCSPYDLVQLNATSKVIRSFIGSHQYLWERSLLNLKRGNCDAVPSPPRIQATGNYSVTAYIAWIFGGGSCSIRNCSRATHNLPWSFILGLRACSRSCQEMLMSKDYIFFDVAHIYDDSLLSRWLPHLVIETPQTPIPIHAYLRKLLTAARHELHCAERVNPKPKRKSSEKHNPFALRDLYEDYPKRQDARLLLEENARRLTEWVGNYLKEKVMVIKANTDFLRATVSGSQTELNLNRVLQTPTLGRLLHAFNRDLEILTPSVWEQNRDAIMTELATTPHIKDLHCSSSKLSDCTSSHPSDQGKRRCPDCPRSSRLYSTHALRDHRSAKHASAAKC